MKQLLRFIAIILAIVVFPAAPFALAAGDNSLETTWERLGKWYASEPQPDTVFAPGMDESLLHSEAVDAELARHERWVELTGITVTPYVVAGDRELPQRYDVEDLMFVY